MSNGGTLPQSAQEVQVCFEKERQSQRYIDRYYLSRGHEIKSRQGTREYDCILLRKGTEEERVEEKFRYNSWGDDFLIELIQDLVSGDIGWFLKTDCDYLHYVLCDKDTCIPYKLFRIQWKDGFPDWYYGFLRENKTPQAIISDRGYGLTVNLSCDWDSIPDNLIFIEDIPEEIVNPQEEE